MYTPIQVIGVRGDGPQEAVTIKVDLRVGDEVRLLIPKFGGSLGAFTVVRFEDGRNGRRPVLRAPDGDLFHMEGSGGHGTPHDSLEVWRDDGEGSFKEAVKEA